MRYVLLVMLLSISACGVGTDADDLVGTWEGLDTKDGIMVFHKDGSFESLDSDGQSLSDEAPTLTITWEVVTEVRPFQLYVTMSVDGKSERIPLGIYKIENSRLVLRESITIHRSIGGFSMGVSRYDMPKDFSGVVSVFKRL